MRQLAGTIVLFFLISCAAASEALDDGDGNRDRDGVITTAEVTVEGSPETESIDLDLPVAKLCDEGKTCTEDPDALKDTKVSLAAPFLEVRAIAVKEEGSGSTMLAVRTLEGWRALPEAFVSYYEDDPGCPSIERESAIREIHVERNALVVVTASDREWLGEDESGPLEMTKARACYEDEGDMTCGEPTVVSAKLSLRSLSDENEKAEPVERTFATKYWVDGDGEIEAEHPYDDATWNESAPGI